MFWIVLMSVLSSHTQSDDTALWIARSCVGEAGFASAETGECAAIAHIYLKRAPLCRKPVQWVARRYSAAIKSTGKKWVRNLDRSGKRPLGWPKHLNWQGHLPKWAAVVSIADGVVNGRVSDPLPDALHYGGRMDKGIDLRYFEIMKTTFRNIFYRRKKR